MSTLRQFNGKLKSFLTFDDAATIATPGTIVLRGEGGEAAFASGGGTAVSGSDPFGGTGGYFESNSGVGSVSVSTSGIGAIAASETGNVMEFYGSSFSGSISNAGTLTMTEFVGGGAGLTGITSSQITDATSSATPGTIVLRGFGGEASFGSQSSGFEGDGLSGQAYSGNAVVGQSVSGNGVYAESNTGTAFYGYSASSNLIQLEGGSGVVFTVSNAGVVTADGSGLTGLKVTRVFADETEQNAATPDFVGQVAYNTELNKISFGLELVVGSWTSTLAVGELAASGVGSTGDISASGTISGSNIDSSGNVIGNAATATTLATSRNIFGISFNGSANVSGDATNAGHFASIPTGGAAGHFITLNGTTPTLIAGRSAWFSDGSGNPSFKNGTSGAVTLVQTNGAGGTPSSLTLTNATGLPVSGITASTTTALGVGSIELGHATDTTLSRASAGRLAVEGVNVVTISSTDTLTNKTLTSPTLNNATAATASTTTPALIISGPTSAVDTIQIRGTTTASYSSIGLMDSGNTQRGSFGYGGSTAGSYASTVFFNSGTTIPMTFGTANVERMRLSTAGGLSIGTTTDAGANNLLVAGSVTATGLTSSGVLALAGTTITASNTVTAVTNNAASLGTSGVRWNAAHITTVNCYGAANIIGDVILAKTITATGTTGAQTINKSSGSVNFAAAATSLVVTNSLCTTSSVILVSMGTNDATANGLRVVAGTGSFTIYMLVAPTTETRVYFHLTN